MAGTHGDYWVGKSVIITGAARGQGAALACKLMLLGAHVHAIDISPLDDSAWALLRSSAEESGGDLRCHAMDIADPEAWSAISSTTRSVDAPPIFGLVNNAGITGDRATVTKSSLDAWDRVINTNLRGAFLGIREIAPLMPRGGAILNVSSTVGMTGYFSAAYATSKWGLRGLTRSAALELSACGVRVNCICPGVVDTDLIRNNAALYEALKGIIPMGQMATAEEIAASMLFLLGPDAAHVTGTDLLVDGGVIGGGLFLPVGRAAGFLS